MASNSPADSNSSASSHQPHPRLPNCVFTSYMTLDCLDGDCKQLERQFRQCENSPREELIKEEDGTQNWRPVKFSASDPIAAATAADPMELFDSTRFIAHRWLNSFHSMNRLFNELDREFFAPIASPFSEANNGNGSNRNIRDIPISLADSNNSNDSSATAAPVHKPRREIITTVSTTTTRSIDEPPLAKRLHDRYESAIEISHSAMRSALDTVFGALGSKKFDSKENEKK